MSPGGTERSGNHPGGPMKLGHPSDHCAAALGTGAVMSGDTQATAWCALSTQHPRSLPLECVQLSHLSHTVPCCPRCDPVHLRTVGGRFPGKGRGCGRVPLVAFTAPAASQWKC